MVGRQPTCRLFFPALTLFYVSLTPGTIEGLGYNRENVVAADQLAANLIRWPIQTPLAMVEWPPHGWLEPILELPFVLLGRLLFGPSVKWACRVAALQPILATSLLCSIVYVWARRLTPSAVRSYSLAVAAGLSTMLWPYAYIGLETTQSLALLAAGFLALGREYRHAWPATLAFAAACATAVSAKLSGVFLAPAVAYLIACYFRDAQGSMARRRALWRAAVVAATVALIYWVSYRTRAQYWAMTPGGEAGYYAGLLADGPLAAAFQAFSFFGSPNKSLLIYAPLVALSFVTLRRAYHRRPPLAVFAGLTLAGLVGGFSLVVMWAEETWGPRYLHAAVAPFVICLAAGSGARFRWRREIPLLALISLGFGGSFIGVFFPYTKLHLAAISSSQSTLERLQYDPAWNHLRFNLRLLKVWVREEWAGGAGPQPWPPAPHWWFERPADAPPEKMVDLRDYAQPQPLLARGWVETFAVSPRAYLILRMLCALSLGLSIVLLVRLGFMAARTERDGPDPGSFSTIEIGVPTNE